MAMLFTLVLRPNHYPICPYFMIGYSATDVRRYIAILKGYRNIVARGIVGEAQSGLKQADQSIRRRCRRPM
jgi:hypothetical protein